MGLGGAVLRFAEDVPELLDAGVSADLFGVWVDEDESTVVVVGADGTVGVRSGGSFDVEQITRGDLLGVHGGPSGVFAVGEGGRAFASDSPADGFRPSWTGTESTLRGVWVGADAASEPRVFAVGDRGTILELR